MAKFSGASGSLYLNVYIEPGAPNYADNTTVVNWRMTVSRTGAYYTYNENGDSTLSLDLNGGRVHTSNPRWHTSGEEFQMASGSTTVGHNPDGTKSFGFSATFNPNNGLHGVITVSGNITLQTIPRSSSISFSTGTIGSPLAITVNRAASSFTHTLRWAWGNRSGTIASGVTTSASWTIPMDFCNELPNNISGTGTIFVDTYSGSSLIGTQSKTFTANVPSSVIPTFTGITLEDQNATAKSLLTGNTFVQIMSNIKVTFNGAAGAYGSTIKGFRAEVLNKDIILTSNGGTFEPMNFNGTATIRASVTDSRGRVSATKDVTITLLEYYAPAISIQVLRTRENPNKLQVLRTIKVAPLTFNNVDKNSTKLVFEVAPLGSNSFVVDNGAAGGEWTTIFTLTNSEANLGGTYDSTTSWTIRAKLSDKFTSSNPSIVSTTVGTESVINACDKDGRFGVGKIPELGPAGSLDVAGNIYADGKQIQQYQLTSNSGYIINDYYTDFNTHTRTGIYHKGVQNNTATPNAPSAVWGILQVYAADNGGNILQIYTERDSPRRTFMRVRSNLTWYGWKEYATTDHPNLINTGWISTGATGVHYKRQGDVVALRLRLNTTANQSYDLGRIPAELIPIPNNGTMMRVASWTADQSIGRNLQINGDGTMALLSSGRGDTINTQVTWII